MRTLTTIAALLVAVALLSPAPASATLITVDPDSFASGTDISAAFPGVSLVALGQAIPTVYSGDPGVPGASTGTRVFGNSDDGYEWGDGFNGGMRANFASWTSYVSIDIIGNDSFDIGRLLAYDIFNTLLGTYTTGALTTGVFVTASISRPTADIAYVVATGSADGIHSISLDNLRFDAEPVPEPGTMLLLGSGLAGMALRRRRRS